MARASRAYIESIDRFSALQRILASLFTQLYGMCQEFNKY